MSDSAEHFLRINDEKRAWVETRYYATEEGAGKFDVYVALCSCGHRFEGKDSSQVTKSWAKHVEVAER